MSKKKPSQNQKTILGIILVIGIIFLFIFMQSAFFNKDAIQFSCKEGKITGYSLTRAPPLSVADSSTCGIEMQVFLEEELICEGKGRDIMGSGNVVIECGKMSNYIGEEVSVEFIINKNDGTTEKKEEKFKIEIPE